MPRIEVHVDPIEIRIHPGSDLLDRLDRLDRNIEHLRSSLIRKLGSIMDTLDDVKAAGLALNVDVDGALDALAERDTRADAAEARVADLEAQLANAGVDPAARQEIIDLFRAEQQKVADARAALDPAVPVPGGDTGSGDTGGGGENPPA